MKQKHYVEWDHVASIALVLAMVGIVAFSYRATYRHGYLIAKQEDAFTQAQDELNNTLNTSSYHDELIIH